MAASHELRAAGHRLHRASSKLGDSVMPLVKIVSGGQTGVDRGALDAALAAGFPCGGWCPEGRLAEDGVIADCYPIIGLARGRLRGAHAPERPRQRRHRDTAFGKTGGRHLAHRGALREARQAAGADRCVDLPTGQAAREIAAFVERERIAVLNVAGPRASKWPGARDYAYAVVSRLLRRRPRKPTNSHRSPL